MQCHQCFVHCQFDLLHFRLLCSCYFVMGFFSFFLFSCILKCPTTPTMSLPPAPTHHPSVVHEEGERSDSVVPLHELLICHSAIRKGFPVFSDFKSGRMRRTSGMALLGSGVQERHPWMYVLSWCHRQIKYLLFSPVF